MWIYHKCKVCGIEIVEEPHKKGVFTMIYENCQKCEAVDIIDKGTVKIVKASGST